MIPEGQRGTVRQVSNVFSQAVNAMDGVTMISDQMDYLYRNEEVLRYELPSAVPGGPTEHGKLAPGPEDPDGGRRTLEGGRPMSVLLETPVLWILFGAALGLCLLTGPTGDQGIFTVLSALLAIIGCAYALLLGAGAAEIAVILLAFLLLNLEGWK